MTQSNHKHKLSNCKLQTEYHIYWGRLLSKALYCSMTAYIFSSENPAGNQTSTAASYSAMKSAIWRLASRENSLQLPECTY